MNSKKNLPNASKFIIKLVAMIKEFPEIINWSQDGEELEIYNVQLFISQVHPKYFTTSNYKSFLRQLNMYNFSKMSKRKNSISFRHPNFCKGQDHLFETIKRRRQSNKRLDANPSHFSDSMEQISKQSCTEFQNTSISIAEEVNQSLKQVKKALNGRANEAFLKLQSQLEKLLALNKVGALTQGKTRQVPLFQDYLSMHKIQNMVRQNRQIFTQSDYQYHLQSNIFNEAQC